MRSKPNGGTASVCARSPCRQSGCDRPAGRFGDSLFGTTNSCLHIRVAGRHSGGFGSRPDRPCHDRRRRHRYRDYCHWQGTCVARTLPHMPARSRSAEFFYLVDFTKESQSKKRLPAADKLAVGPPCFSGRKYHLRVWIACARWRRLTARRTNYFESRAGLALKILRAKKSARDLNRL